MKLPTDEQIIELLDEGLNSMQIAAKFKRTYISIQTRIANIHYKAEMEQHEKNRPKTEREKTEDEIIEDRRWANPCVGDVKVVNGELVHRFTDETINV
jgi:hypothetical protein